MKILFVDNERWSQYNFRGFVIEELVKLGHEIVCLAPSDDNDKLIKKLGTKAVNINLDRKGINIFKDIYLLFQLFLIYRKEKPDLIFHYTIKPNIYGSIVAKFLKIKCISIIPGLGYTFLKKSPLTIIVKILYKISLKKVFLILVLNRDDKLELIKNNISSSNKIDILPSEGIDTKKFKPLKMARKDKNIVFLMVARILWDKGFKEYVEAAKIIKQNYKNVEFRLLGPIDHGNPSAVKKEEVLKYHKNKTIDYLGTSQDIPNIIKECDCFVLPSYYREGIPRTLLEAAAMEKPIITTKSIGCKEVVDDGINGFLCNTRSSEDLVKKIEIFLNLAKDEKIIMGKKGRIKVMKEFDKEIVLKHYIEIIGNLEKL